jgi:hypothetical protein
LPKRESKLYVDPNKEKVEDPTSFTIEQLTVKLDNLDAEMDDLE